MNPFRFYNKNLLIKYPMIIDMSDDPTFLKGEVTVIIGWHPGDLNSTIVEMK